MMGSQLVEEAVRGHTLFTRSYMAYKLTSACFARKPISNTAGLQAENNLFNYVSGKHMMKLLLIPIIIFCIALPHPMEAQQLENTAWLFVTHKQKLNKKFDVLTDFQIRSSDHIDYLTTLLLRAALNYTINTKNSVAVGYAYKGDWVKKTPEKVYRFENRIYQQYQYETKINTIEVTLRGRLEERFLKENNTLFTMRARSFGSIQVPLITNDDFSTVLFAGIQDELFFTIVNMENVNNSIFDQNRVYISLGYRFSKHIDTTLDYGLWSQRENINNSQTNIFRLSFTSNF